MKNKRDFHNLKIRFANQEDEKWIHCHDDLGINLIDKKIDRSEYIVALYKDQIIGYMRFSFFWSKIPFIDIIRVEKEYRGKGIGRSLLIFFENYSIENGFEVVMSSSQANELSPQKWHAKVGFVKAGVLNNFLSIQKDSEIIFIKSIHTDSKPQTLVPNS